MKLRNAALLIFLLLVIDQYSKIYVKTNFILGEQVKVFNWFKLYFIENEGMAWGTVIPGEYGKLFLTLFRIIAVGVIAYWLWDSVKKRKNNFLIVAISLIFAGALGNIIDSVFYGVIFDDSTHRLATLFTDQPYGTQFHGKVVDMFYFPIIENYVRSRRSHFYGCWDFDRVQQTCLCAYTRALKCNHRSLGRRNSRGSLHTKRINPLGCYTIIQANIFRRCVGNFWNRFK